jgi:hypothetical protein
MPKNFIGSFYRMTLSKFVCRQIPCLMKRRRPRTVTGRGLVYLLVFNFVQVFFIIKAPSIVGHKIERVSRLSLCLFWNASIVRSFRVGLSSKQEKEPNTNKTNIILFITYFFCNLKKCPALSPRGFLFTN